MDRNSEPVKFWHVGGPLLLYWLIQFVAQLAAELVVMIPNIGRVIDYDALEKSTTTEEMTEVLLGSMQGMYEIIGEYMFPILAFGALCTLLLTVPLFLKDRKKERVQHMQVVKIPGIKKYLIVFALGSAFCIGLNCLMMLSTLALSSLEYQEVTMQDGVIVQILCTGVIVPIAEEVMFRGLVFKRFRERSSFFSAALLSSVIFGLVSGNTMQMLYVGALGMLLAYTYEICGTIKMPVVLHISVNVMGILLTDSVLGTWLLGDLMRIGGAVILSAFVGSSMYVLLRRMKPEPAQIPPVE